MNNLEMERILNEMKEDFIRVLNPNHVIGNLYQANLLTYFQYEDIKHSMKCNDSRKVISELLDIIVKVDPKYNPIDEFVKILNEKNHPTLAEDLEKRSKFVIHKTPGKVKVSKKLQVYTSQCLKYVNGVVKNVPDIPYYDREFVVIQRWAKIRIEMKDGLAKKDPKRLDSMFEETFGFIGQSHNADYLNMMISYTHAWVYWEKGEKKEGKGIFEQTMRASFSKLLPCQETCAFLFNLANYYLTLDSENFTDTEIAGFQEKAKELLGMAQQHADVVQNNGELDATYERIQKLNYAGSLLNFLPSYVYSGEAVSNHTVVNGNVSQENLKKAENLLDPKNRIWQDGIEDKYKKSHYVHLAVLNYMKGDLNKAIEWLDKAESLLKGLPQAYHEERDNIIKWKTKLESSRSEVQRRCVSQLVVVIVAVLVIHFNSYRQ